MSATVDGDHVVVTDTAEANRIYNKGFFGEPQPGNTLRLSRTEAAYLVAQQRLVLDAPFAELVTDEATYLAYADLRDRGLVVRHDGDVLHVWQRGEGPPKEPWLRMHAVNERDALRVDVLASWAGDIVAVVDEDAAVTHYSIEQTEPEGTMMAVDLPVAQARLLTDRVLVDDRSAHDEEAFGTPQGDSLWLSLTEAEALRRRGVIDVPGLAEHARGRQHHFDRTLPVFLDLRRRGVVAKSGFRFGTHLRGYRHEPGRGHADWLVHCVRPMDAMHWSEVSRGVRLAHGVRKAFLVADADACTYTHVAWFRP